MMVAASSSSVFFASKNLAAVAVWQMMHFCSLNAAAGSPALTAAPTFVGRYPAKTRAKPRKAAIAINLIAFDDMMTYLLYRSCRLSRRLAFIVCKACADLRPTREARFY